MLWDMASVHRSWVARLSQLLDQTREVVVDTPQPLQTPHDPCKDNPELKNPMLTCHVAAMIHLTFRSIQSKAMLGKVAYKLCSRATVACTVLVKVCNSHGCHRVVHAVQVDGLVLLLHHL